MGNFNPMYITFSVYLIAVLLIGLAAYFSTRDFDDYILGGRSLGAFVTAMSAGASDMSGWLLMGLPGAIYFTGLSESWVVIGLVLGAYLNWRLIAGRLRVHTEYCNNAMTLPDYFYHRFGAKGHSIKVLSASIILFFFTVYSAAGVVAGARLFQSLFEVSYTQAMWLGAAATIIYTFIGGFLAVSWTDTIQATLMIFALVLTPVMVYLNLGGADEMSAAIQAAAQANGKFYSDFLHGTTVVGIISSVAWGLGYFGQPHILARFMAADSVKSLVKARRIGMSWMIACLGGAVLVGYFGIAYFGMRPEDAVFMKGDHERVFIALTTILFNPWIAGVILSAILAAVMSTLSAQLLVCSSAVTEDFYKGFLRPNAPQKELVWIGRLMVLAVAGIAMIIASDPNSKVLGLVSYAWAGFGAAFGPIVILSLVWKRMTEQGALAGMLAAAVTVVAWKPMTGSALYEMVPGFIVGAIVAIAVSLATKSNAEVEKRFEQAEEAFKKEHME
ncbi:sodium/proline symporter PutP [Kingella negevensis]|uniref:Sodium/proline symporter n=1 Tax=Kingella negevensis TaxID=1522312 RepID=A0A238HG46_9NEIS|nr:sodium/proline symporter PutP [Kingella negevensis]MDK4680099.1 sodium/proline symporter PutP [Kingella negevensis]MDK4682181.1 sodium/proline symporter PutP [Kingella negevensis]MDK4690378.1 sodium/proline symporter PutP [Kingella negevensis]MDK4692274.1 sodium/proline symporter PutP [Kingella negevensis]MDK4696416.1 sodium/proline symporter PutP [Kingella negevensis]